MSDCYENRFSSSVVSGTLMVVSCASIRSDILNRHTLIFKTFHLGVYESYGAIKIYLNVGM
jgi:hypothetical protein